MVMLSHRIPEATHNQVGETAPLSPESLGAEKSPFLLGNCTLLPPRSDANGVRTPALGAAPRRKISPSRHHTEKIPKPWRNKEILLVDPLSALFLSHKRCA